ncbi:MAG: aspartate dehydrogenase [Lachnospiraceae bacterium]|jgi:hypothetical protein|uniref:hypothetical protein n=1 Tax=Oribacterium sp. FC2011 TaxID=1408311 RepID=UPI0004E22633|nr:hypothetical protein [Oribacterium sp. FC2011]MBE6004105.1 aspartate dehydrogenase [Lachnospiraceae bacterium]
MFNIFLKKKPDIPEYNYDPEKEIPVIRASICNGEQVAGFKDKKTGAFHELMVIRGEKDIAEFKNAFSLRDIRKEY